MARKENAPVSGANGNEGAVCLLGCDTGTDITNATRVQFLTRLGIPLNRAVLVAAHCFGEAHHG